MAVCNVHMMSAFISTGETSQCSFFGGALNMQRWPRALNFALRFKCPLCWEVVSCIGVSLGLVSQDVKS